MVQQPSNCNYEKKQNAGRRDESSGKYGVGKALCAADLAGALVLLDPRPIVITDLDADIATLFVELVSEL